MGGALVFVGTRVPVQTLLEHLQAGDSLDEFLRNFPSVHREQAVAALEVAKDLLSQPSRAAASLTSDHVSAAPLPGESPVRECE